MQLQWTFTAGILYLEVAIVTILLLPFISPRIWQKFFRSKFLAVIQQQSSVYFGVILLLLVLFFVDAYREMNRFSEEKVEVKNEQKHDFRHYEAEDKVSMKLFRSQRNFYISGFSLFLWFVIQRLVTLISAQAVFMENREESKPQAKSSSGTTETTGSSGVARVVLQHKRGPLNRSRRSENSDNVLKEEHEDEVKQLKAKLLEAQEAALIAQTDLKTMKQQSDSISSEYDRVRKELHKLKGGDKGESKNE
jgi:B-cell receptor-associated protein 31